MESDKLGIIGSSEFKALIDKLGISELESTRSIKTIVIKLAVDEYPSISIDTERTDRLR